MQYLYDGDKVILKHNGYVLRLFGKNIPLPISFLIGKGHAEERAIDAHSFSMFMRLTHPLFGTLYEYQGSFEVVDV